MASVRAKPIHMIGCSSFFASGCRAEACSIEAKIRPTPSAVPNAASPTASPKPIAFPMTLIVARTSTAKSSIPSPPSARARRAVVAYLQDRGVDRGVLSVRSPICERRRPDTPFAARRRALNRWWRVDGHDVKCEPASRGRYFDPLAGSLAEQRLPDRSHARDPALADVELERSDQLVLEGRTVSITQADEAADIGA